MNRFLLSTTVTLALLGVAAPVCAQAPRPERPYRGLFGGGMGNAEQSLTVQASLGGGYDTNIVADAIGRDRPSPSDLNTTFRGSVGQSSVRLAYALTRARMTLSASAGSSLGYYPSLDQRFIRRDDVNAAALLYLGKGFSANASGRYAPYVLTSIFANVVDPLAVEPTAPIREFAFSSEHYMAYNAGGGYDHELSRRTRFTANYQYRAQESSVPGQHFTGHSAGGRLTHDVSRGLGLRAGYRYADARYAASDRRPRHHVIDAGVDYNRSLSFSRRTVLSFATGTTAMTTPQGSETVTRFRATGNINLNHEIGRTWNARLAYARGAEFVDTWPEPVFSDALIASVSGSLSRRVQFQSTARAATGNIGFTDEGGPFDTLEGTAGLSVAVSRYAGVGVSYAYYRHRFGPNVLLPPGFTDHLDRQSVRGYVTLWAPLFHRARRADVTR